MTYKYDTPLTASNLNLKFQMINEDEDILDYEQRMVVGIKIDNSVFSEHDIPTKKGSVVNFRIADQNGSLVPGGNGGSISSPIKDGGIINLEFKTQPKHSQDITQILDLDYVSAIEKYGGEEASISHDVVTDDSQPETARANLFIGSYQGGCIKIISWQAN